MAKLRLTALALAIALLLLGASSVFGVSAQQTTDDKLLIGAQTTITLTVKLADGSTITMPVGLQITTTVQDGAASMDVNVNEGEGTAATTSSVHISAVIESATESPTPTSTATSTSTTVIANSNANLRQGPGTNYPKVGTVQAGQELQVIDQNSDGTWLQLDNGAWIAKYLVSPAPGTSEVTANAVLTRESTPTSSPTDTAEPTAMPTSTPAPPTPTPVAPKATPQPTATTVAAPTAAGAWYEGGTLHKATWADWKAATHENKMATAADWVTNLYEPQWQTFKELEDQATELVTCVDGVADVSIAAWGENSSIADMVVSCVLIMMDKN